MTLQALSARQIEIFRLVGKGLCRKEIADAMGVAPGTIQSLMARAKKRSGASNAAHLAVMVALEHKNLPGAWEGTPGK